MAKIVSKNDPDTKKVWCKYGKIPGQGDGVNLFFVGEINVTHYFITNIGIPKQKRKRKQNIHLLNKKSTPKYLFGGNKPKIRK